MSEITVDQPAGSDTSDGTTIIGLEAGAEPAVPEGSSGGAAAEAPSVGDGAAPAWTPDDPAFRDAVASEAQAIAEATFQRYLQQAGFDQYQDQPESAQTPGQVALDPFSDDFGQQLQQTIQQTMQDTIGQLLGPLYEERQAAAEQELNQRAEDLLHDTIASFGDLAIQADGVPDQVRDQARQLIMALGDRFVAREAQRYGMTPRAAEVAMQKAVAAWSELEQAIGRSAVERHTNQLSSLAGAAAEPGVTPAVRGTRVEGDEMALARALMAGRTSI